MRFPNWLDWWLIKEGRAKKRSLTGNQTGQKFDLGVPVSKTIRKQMFIVDSTQPAVFCYGSLSSLVQWVPRCYCCCWSRDHFENRGCGQWKPVKVPAVFLSTFTITVFFFFPRTGSCFQCQERSAKDYRKAGTLFAQWVSPISLPCTQFHEVHFAPCWS